MSDFIHEWRDEQGHLMRAKQDGPMLIILSDSSKFGHGVFWECPMVSRRDCEQLLIAFDKLKGKS